MERWSIEVDKEYLKFSAAHFLIFPDGSAERLHGHNYRVEVAVLSPFEPADGRGFDVLDMERIVHGEVIERFDHRHLNLDCVEFANVNPSVEHIARVCHELLVEPIAAAGGTLAYVTVWETDKTASTYPAQALASGMR